MTVELSRVLDALKMCWTDASAVDKCSGGGVPFGACALTCFVLLEWPMREVV